LSQGSIPKPDRDEGNKHPPSSLLKGAGQENCLGREKEVSDKKAKKEEI